MDWFADPHGSRTFDFYESSGHPGHHFDFTLGLNWNPRILRGDGYYYAPVIIRPEVRYDYFAGGGAAPNIEQPFQARTSRHQMTVALSTVIKF